MPALTGPHVAAIVRGVLGSITGLLLILLVVLFRKRFVNQRNSTLSKASSGAFLLSLYVDPS
jgi:hypothetical protein